MLVKNKLRLVRSNLDEILKKTGMTRRELAQSIFVTPETMARYFEKRWLPRSKAKLIADALEVDVEAFTKEFMEEVNVK